MTAQKKAVSKTFIYLFLVLALLVSFVAGGVLLPSFMRKLASTPDSGKKLNPSLPSDLVKISGCIPFEGEHFVSPKDLPHGPYYIVYNDKLMALEYMFTPDDIPGGNFSKMTINQFVKYMQDKKVGFSEIVNEIRSFYFKVPDIDVKYFDIHWTAPHAGELDPHYDMHLYLADKEEMDKICPDSKLEEIFTEDIIRSNIDAKIPLPQAP